MDYLKAVNGLPMAILCGIILIMFVQSALMSSMAWKRDKELGLAQMV